MKKWNLNGNGIAFLTDAEQAKVNASTNQNLRFKAQHGIVFSDADPDSPDTMPHLYCGDNIVGSWAEPAVVAQPLEAMAAAASGGSVGADPVILAELRQMNATLQRIAAATEVVARAVSSTAPAGPAPTPTAPPAPQGLAS